LLEVVTVVVVKADVAVVLSMLNWCLEREERESDSFQTIEKTNLLESMVLLEVVLIKAGVAVIQILCLKRDGRGSDSVKIIHCVNKYSLDHILELAGSRDGRNLHRRSLFHIDFVPETR
jgi:hypothetical protein